MNEQIDKETLRKLTRTLYMVQDTRIRMANRLHKKLNGEDQKVVANINIENETLPILVDVWHDFEKQEKALKKQIEIEVERFPIYTNFLSEVKGCGPLLSAVIITEFDINIATTVSKMWAFAGLAPGRDRLVKGQKSCFNTFLRSKLCGVLGGSFLKCKSPYSVHYYEYKNRLENSESVTWKDATKIHIHRAAMRKMIKEFLKDLYVAWRTLDDLPMRRPYEEEYLGRSHHEEVI